MQLYSVTLLSNKFTPALSFPPFLSTVNRLPSLFCKYISVTSTDEGEGLGLDCTVRSPFKFLWLVSFP